MRWNFMYVWEQIKKEILKQSISIHFPTQEHEAEEEVGKEHDADHAHHKRRVEAGLSKRAAHHSTSSAEGA